MNDIGIDFFTWASAHSGDIPTWILAIATPFSIYLGFRMAKGQIILSLEQLRQNIQQQKQASKIEEQKFFFEIDKILTSEDAIKIRNKIDNEIYNKVKIDMNESGIIKIIDNYLNHLEFVCNLYQKELISKIMIDDFAGMQIGNVMKCESIKKYIHSEQKRTGEEKLWIMIKQVNDDLYPKSEIKSIRSESPVTKSGITIYPDGTKVDSHGTIL